ncbi:MAG: VPLPA-CTERM sorting domain-containing protein [Gammaproteobacteria bacterium]|nr:VPLPA-CTERM sorting domain-containing protein [Gammaproteobacteria bacterium]
MKTILQSLRSLRKITFLGIALGFANTPPVAAFERTWLCGSGYWDTESCWSNSYYYPVPSRSDSAALTQSDSIDRVVTYRQINNTYVYSYISTLTVDATGIGTMTLYQSQDSLATNTEWLGYSGFGAYSQSGGSNSTTFMYLGQESTGKGVYNLTGGTLTASVEVIGRNGSGSFTQSGGLNSSTNNFVLAAYNNTSRGAYNLSGTGRLETSNADIGYYGIGIFNQVGASHSVGSRMTLGVQGGSVGEYHLSGNGSLSVGIGLTIGNGGRGVFIQDSGIVSVGDYVAIGGNSSYMINGGTLTASRIYNGYGPGSLHVNGGTLDIGNGDGLIDVDSLYIGSTTGANGSHTLSGNGSLITGTTILGASGHGEFIQNGGTHTISGALVIADANEGTGKYVLGGGVLDSRDVIVNDGGLFEFSGGSLFVNNYFGDLINNGGSLSSGSPLEVTNIFGNFTQLAGELDLNIGGRNIGEYGALNVDGIASLGGKMSVSFSDLGYGLFSPQAGDTFDILTAESLVGHFDYLSLLALGDGLDWSVNYLTDAVGTTDILRLSVVSAVPVPASIWLLVSGLLGLGGIVKRKAP